MARQFGRNFRVSFQQARRRCGDDRGKPPLVHFLESVEHRQHQIHGFALGQPSAARHRVLSERFPCVVVHHEIAGPMLLEEVPDAPRAARPRAGRMGCAAARRMTRTCRATPAARNTRGTAAFPSRAVQFSMGFGRRILSGRGEVHGIDG